MKINEFSNKTGITIYTLRYYDKIGLLKPSRHDNIRNYTEGDLEIAEAIVRLKKLNFTVSEIRELIDLSSKIERENNRENLEKLLKLLEEKNMDLEDQYREVVKTKNQLKKMTGKVKMLLEGKVKC